MYKDPEDKKRYNVAYRERNRAALNEYDRELYKNNRERRRENEAALRQERKREIDEIKRSAGCIDCGEKDPIVLDFDHRDPSKKVLAIATMRLRRFSMEKLMAEIDKCDVRCSNCHRRKTHQERK